MPVYGWQDSRTMWQDRATAAEREFHRHYFVCPRCGVNADYFIGGTENWWCSSAPKFCPSCGRSMKEDF